MEPITFVVSCQHQGIDLKPQQFLSEEQALEHASYMAKVVDAVTVTTCRQQKSALLVSDNALRKDIDIASKGSSLIPKKRLQYQDTFVVLIVENDSDSLTMLKNCAESGGEIAVLSARSFWGAATWIHAAERIDLLISAVGLTGTMDGVDVADLALNAHPSIEILLVSSHKKKTIRGLVNRYQFLRKPLSMDEVTHHIDMAYLAFLQGYVSSV